MKSYQRSKLKQTARGVEGRSVVKPHAASKEECPAATVLARLPALRQLGYDRSSTRGDVDEAFEDLVGDAVRRESSWASAGSSSMGSKASARDEVPPLLVVACGIATAAADSSKPPAEPLVGQRQPAKR